jgi:hypothetical protein
VTIHAHGLDILKLIHVTIRLPGLNEARGGGAAARGVEVRVTLKERHYRRVYGLTGIRLVPFAADVWGYLSALTCDLLDWLAQTKSKTSTGFHLPYRKHQYQYIGRVSAAIASGTAFSLSQYVYRAANCNFNRAANGYSVPAKGIKNTAGMVDANPQLKKAGIMLPNSVEMRSTLRTSKSKECRLS